ncbi:MAG: cytochrome P450 [Myxococcota bacterium]
MNTTPGPKSYTLGLRNAWRMSTRTLDFLSLMRDEYGDVARLTIFNRPWFVLSHPDDIETCLVKQSKVMVRDQYVEILKRTLGLGLLTNDGEDWKRQRKLMARAFTPRRIKNDGETMAAVGDRSLRGFHEQQEINIHQEMSRVTMEVVAEVLFGTGVDPAEVDVVRDSMETINEFYANSPEAVLMVPEWVPTPRNFRVRKSVRAIDGVIYRIIADRRAGPVRDDFLGTLLKAQDDGGTGMNDQQLRDEAITLFLAGHETTALALAATFYLLAQNPAVEERLYEEVRHVLDGRLPTASDVKDLPYAGRVLKEAMRIYPPAWTTGREAAEDVEIGGHHVPKGSQIMTSQWVVHRDPRWFPNPLAFDPDRWEDESAIPRYAYFPFGGGPRVCIGNHFAMMEATLLLAISMQRYHYELLPNQTLEFDPAVTLRPKGPGLRMRVHERPALARSIRPPQRQSA